MNIFKCIHNEISTQKHNNIGTYLITVVKITVKWYLIDNILPK